ncbi:hypothetical protein DL93DRAFT_2225936 [Clavulina sp. PMI_390]|nr:hypothetical protein DL93DRAFT_2225936 [Clavulina sp. PMI_390]
MIIGELQSFQDRLREQYAVYASALVPITALPTEILSDIFQYVVLSGQGSAYGLSQVCSHWKTVISCESALCQSTITGVRLGGNVESAISAAQAAPSRAVDLKVIDQDEDWPSRIEKAVPDFHERLRTLEWLSAAHIDRFLVHPFVEKRTFRMLESIKIGKTPRRFGTWGVSGPGTRPPHTPELCQGLSKNAFPVLKRLEFEKARNLRELVLWRVLTRAITEITAPLNTLAPHLHRLAFSTDRDDSARTFEPLVDHIVSIANARAKAESLAPFAIHTQMDLIPALQPLLPDTYPVSEIVKDSGQGDGVDVFL